MTKTTTTNKELGDFESFSALRGSGAFGTGRISHFGHRATPAGPVKHRDTQPLTSENFAHMMDALDAAGAHDLKYLKMSEYLNKTGKLLDIPMPRLQLGYSDKAECATDRVNFPVMASIYETVSQKEIQQYVQELVSLPTLFKDTDYCDAASVLFRSVGSRNKVERDYPGFKAAWGDFFGDLFIPGFQTLPNMVSDPDRKLLFEALNSVVSGKITAPELRKHSALIESVTDAFQTGDLQQFGDALYALSAELTHTPPPEPPADPDEEQPDEDQPDDEGEGEPNQESTGGSGDKENEQDGEHEEDSAEPEQPKPGEGEPDEGDADEEAAPEKDPFASLAQFIRNVNPDTMPDTESINAADQFAVDDVDFDPNGLEELLELEVDITIPDTAPGLQSVYYRTPVPPGASKVWALMRSTYQQQITEVTRLIDEFYRTKTINERGLLTGRADGARLYRVNFGSRDVFKRSHIDSVGHMDMIVLLDESGSMSNPVSDFKQPSESVLSTMSSLINNNSASLLQGKSIGEFDSTRANLARLMGFLALEAAKSLDGFNVEVAGYLGTLEEHLPEKVRPVHRAVRDMAAASTGRGQSSSLAPVVRMLGDKQQPLALTASSGIYDNADIQALAWGIERMEKSSADQRVIVFCADGCVNDQNNTMPKLLARAKRAGIYIHFMDMSEGAIPDSSPLNELPKHEVSSFKSMFSCLTYILQKVTSEYV